MFPRRRKSVRTKPQPDRVREPSYLAWIRGCLCAIEGVYDSPWRTKHVCEGRIEAAHVRTGTDGAMGVKPSDCYSIPLCEKAHRLQHQIGEPAFEKMFDISMRKTAGQYWQAWLHNTTAGQRYRGERQ